MNPLGEASVLLPRWMLLFDWLYLVGRMARHQRRQTGRWR